MGQRSLVRPYRDARHHFDATGHRQTIIACSLQRRVVHRRKSRCTVTIDGHPRRRVTPAHDDQRQLTDVITLIPSLSNAAKNRFSHQRFIDVRPYLERAKRLRQQFDRLHNLETTFVIAMPEAFAQRRSRTHS